jgi:hypothetical protein
MNANAPLQRSLLARVVRHTVGSSSKVERPLKRLLAITLRALAVASAIGIAQADGTTHDDAAQDWLMLVGTRSTDPARDADFNKWYDQIDIPDVLRVAGYRRARRGQRLAIATLPAAGPAADIDQYVALYDIESSDIQRTMLDMTMASKKMETTGRTTDLLRVVERVYFRQLGQVHQATRALTGGKRRFLFLERVECCRDDATDNQLNDWYETQRVPGLLTLPGVTRISRYHVYRVLMVEPKIVPRFLTVCEFEGDSPQAFVDARNRLNERSRAASAMSELFQEQGSAAYQLIAEVRAR